MARGIKQKSGLNTDSSIQDAMKRARVRRQQLNDAAGITSNDYDDLSRELETEGMSDYERDVFED